MIFSGMSDSKQTLRSDTPAAATAAAGGETEAESSNLVNCGRGLFLLNSVALVRVIFPSHCLCALQYVRDAYTFM